jgi:excisionase family DNA binding protein
MMAPVMGAPDKPDINNLIEWLRQAVSEGLRAALDDLRQQANRPRFVTLAQASRLYGIAARTLRQHIHAGRLRGYAPGGSKLLIETAELEAFVRTAVVDREGNLDRIANEAITEMEASKR